MTAGGRPRPAESLLQSLGVTSPEEIDVEAIAWHVGAKVKYRPLSSCEARILGHGDRAIICVDEGKSAERRKFSVCHELGHWHHHRGRCLACRSDEIGNRARGNALDPERVADGYAADLLLPRYLIAPMAAQVSKWSLARIRELAAPFGASTTATAIRLIEMDAIPGLLVSHRPKGRRWFARAPSAERWFPQDQLDPDSQALRMLFGSDPELRVPSVIGADAWFDRAGADRYEVREQSYRASDGEVVTLLLLPSNMLA